ncbi:Gfo/Idh/MocA family oxidoreductase [Streptomyces cavourensis]
MSPRPAVRVGVLGCADIARRRMLPAFAASPDTEVVAVASRDADRAKALAAPYGARPVQGYAELLADASVDAVHIPLPLALHAEWTEAALRAGKHVLAEKPLTDDPARSAALFALAERSGLALMENVMFVHHRRHAEVARLVAAGRSANSAPSRRCSACRGGRRTTSATAGSWPGAPWGTSGSIRCAPPSTSSARSWRCWALSSPKAPASPSTPRAPSSCAPRPG